MERTNKSRKGMRIAISIVVALVLWVYMEVEISPPVTMQVKDIPVEFTGEDTTLADKGLMILTGYDATVNLTLEGPRSTLWKLKAEDVRVVADTGKISATGVQSLTYDVVYPDEVSTANIKVRAASAWAVTVTVGELYTKEIPIRTEISGTVASGFFTGDLEIDPEVLTLRAQREDLLNVSYAKVNVNISGATNTLIEIVEYTLYDYNDVAVVNNNIRYSTRLVQVTLPVRTVKEVPVMVDLVGTEFANSVQAEISPSMLRLVGEADALSAIDTIVLDKIYVEDLVTGLNGPYVYSVKLPAGVYAEDNTKEAVVTVAVNGTTEKQLSLGTVTCEGVPAGLQAEAVVPITINLWGEETAVNTVTSADVLARVDLSGITEAGVYTLPVTFTLPNAGGVTVHGAYTVSVSVTARATETSRAETTDPTT